MPSPSESKRDNLPETVPAGTDGTNLGKRMLSRELAEAAREKDRYWYHVGQIMARWEVKGPQAKKLIEKDGHVLHWDTNYLRAMRRTVETVVGSDVEDRRASQCPFAFVRHVMRHLRTGAIEEQEARLAISRRSRHIGTPNKSPFSDIVSKDGIRELIHHFTQKPQDAQQPQANE